MKKEVGIAVYGTFLISLITLGVIIL